MKIKVLVKGSVNAKPQGYCSTMIDDPPMNKK